MDDLGDGVDGLGVRQEVVGDRGYDVKGTLHKLLGVGAVQLPGPEHSLNAVPVTTGNKQAGECSTSLPKDT